MGGTIPGGNFPGGIIQGEFDGWEFCGWKFSRGEYLWYHKKIFTRLNSTLFTTLFIEVYSEHFFFFYNIFFSKIKIILLKVPLCRIYNNKYIIASTHTEIFAFNAILVFKLLSRKVLFINRRNNRNC